MSLIQLIVLLIVVCLVWALLDRYVPLPPIVWLIIRVLLVLLVVVLLRNTPSIWLHLGAPLRL